MKKDRTAGICKKDLAVLFVMRGNKGMHLWLGETLYTICGRAIGFIVTGAFRISVCRVESRCSCSIWDR